MSQAISRVLKAYTLDTFVIMERHNGKVISEANKYIIASEYKVDMRLLELFNNTISKISHELPSVPLFYS